MLGYDMTTAQLVGLEYEAYVAKGGRIPDVILVSGRSVVCLCFILLQMPKLGACRMSAW